MAIKFNSKMPLKFNPTTPVKFYAKKSTYVPGKGSTVTWELIESILKPETEGSAEIKASVFYCEWRTLYGERALTAQSLGVEESANIRTHYNPDIYSKLKSVIVVIVKNADDTAIVNGIPDKDNLNCYELWGGVDNVAEENQYMEFRVRRYEGK